MSATGISGQGGGLGYGPDTPGGGGGIPNSIAVKFDLFQNQTEGNNSTGLYIDGASPTVPAIDLTSSGVNLHSGDVMMATLSYDGSTLTETITDTQHPTETFTHQYLNVDIPTIVGNNLAYVGFGGGTGGLTSKQDIQTWTYTSTDNPNIIHAPRNLKVTSVVEAARARRTSRSTGRPTTPTTRPGSTSSASTDGSTWTTIAVISPNLNTYTDPGLTGGIYYYRVQSFNTSTSSTSNVDSVLVGGGKNPAVIDSSQAFVSPSDITPNGSTKFVVNNGTTVARLTDGGTNETGTVFYTHRVDVTSFDTTFTLQMQSGTVPMGDGMTFIIQGNSPTAIPPQSGGGLGYGPDHVGGSGGIPNSIAIKFDTFNNQNEGNNSTGLFVDGDAPTIPTSSRDTLVELNPNVINLTSGDPFLVHLTYGGTTLTETITDTITGGTFTTNYTVNIPGYVGGSLGFVGFGAGTGGNTALQDISAWTYTTQDPGKSSSGASSASQATTAGAAAPAVMQAATAGPASAVVSLTPVPASTAAVDEVLAQYPETPASRKKALVGLASMS